MKKKKIKSKKSHKRQQKIDVVLASLLNLEYQVKELINKIDLLQYNKPYCPKDIGVQPENSPKYWPVDYPKYKDVTWHNK
jgi:hypothetical protein